MGKQYLGALVAVMLFCFTGCSDMQDIDERTYLSAVAIDMGENGYNFCFRTANAVGMTNAVENNKIEYTNYKVEENSFAAAVIRLKSLLAGKVDTEHLDCIIIGDSVADNDILQLLEPLFSDPTARRNCAVFCCKGKAAELLADNFSQLHDVSRISEGINQGIPTVLWDLFSAKEQGIGYILLCVSSESSRDSEFSNIKVVGSFAYNKDGKICEFGEQESIALRLINEKNPKDLQFASKKNDLVFEIVDLNVKKKLNFSDSVPSYTIRITAVCSDLSSQKLSEKEFEVLVTEELSGVLTAVIDKCRINGAYSAIGLEQLFRQNRYDEFTSLSYPEKQEIMNSVQVKLILQVESERAEGYR